MVLIKDKQRTITLNASIVCMLLKLHSKIAMVVKLEMALAQIRDREYRKMYLIFELDIIKIENKKKIVLVK